MPKRSRDRRTNALDVLTARVAELSTTKGCRRLVHLHLGDTPPHITPGCEACIEMARIWESTPRPERPTPVATADDDEEDLFR